MTFPSPAGGLREREEGARGLEGAANMLVLSCLGLRHIAAVQGKPAQAFNDMCPYEIAQLIYFV